MKRHTQTPETILSHHAPAVMARARIEFAIAVRLLRDLTAAGYLITEHEDGFSADNEDAWLAFLFNLDEARLIVTNPATGQTSFVFLVFGNNGYELISDYGTNLEPIMAPLSEWIDAAEEAGAVPQIAEAGADKLKTLLSRALFFIQGFEDDETQDGIPAALCADIRAAGIDTSEAEDMARMNLTPKQFEDFKDAEAPEPEPMLRVFYVCPKCENEWEEEWTSACDSECPKCGTENIEADRFCGIDETDPAEDEDAAAVLCECGRHKKDCTFDEDDANSTHADNY